MGTMQVKSMKRRISEQYGDLTLHYDITCKEYVYRDRSGGIVKVEHRKEIDVIEEMNLKKMNDKAMILDSANEE